MTKPLGRFFESRKAHFNREAWMRSATVIVVIAYGWMASFALAPETPRAERVLSDLRWIENGWSFPLSARPSGFVAGAVIEKAVATLDPAFELVGGFGKPVELLIRADQPGAYLVNEERVELGTSVAMARGQVLKALLKARLLGQASFPASASLLRREVVSDLLLAMSRGKLDLGIPGDSTKLSFAEPQSWLRYAASFESFCRSPWRSLEFAQACEPSGQINPQSFRPLIGSIIWKVYSSVPPLERLGFVRAWITHLENKESQPDWNDGSLPSDILAWREWVRREVLILLPQDLVAAKGLSAKLEQILEQASLAPHDPLRIEAIAKGGPALIQSLTTVGGRSSFQVLLRDDATSTLRLYPGGAGVGSVALKDQSLFSARLLIWESCEAPALEALLGESHLVSRILFVRRCSDEKVNYASLRTFDFESFAHQNPELEFVKLRPTELRMALDKGVIAGSMSVADLVRIQSLPASAEILGISAARWQPEIKAFKVLGSIEAVEIFRVKTAKSADGSASAAAD